MSQFAICRFAIVDSPYDECARVQARMTSARSSYGESAHMANLLMYGEMAYGESAMANRHMAKRHMAKRRSIKKFNFNVQFSLHSSLNIFKTGCHYRFSYPTLSILWRKHFATFTLALIFLAPFFNLSCCPISLINSSVLILFLIGKVVTGFSSQLLRPQDHFCFKI